MPADPDRDPRAVIEEAIGYLALVATRRLYDEQPALWKLGENGRARTLEDFTHHLRALGSLSEDTFRRHVEYCYELFERRGFPHQWLRDAWRILDGVLRDELPEAVATDAVAVLASVTQRT